MFKYCLLPLVSVFIFISHGLLAQKVNEFPKKTDPLYKKVEMFDRLMYGNHWNEVAIMQQVITIMFYRKKYTYTPLAYDV